MKVRATLLAIPLFVGTALAQTNPAGQTGATGTTAQSGSVTGTQQQAPPAEMKTMTYKGVLVDLACNSGAATASAAPANPPATQPANRPATGASSADRSSGDCPVTANSTQFGLKMDDGKVVKFDLVGNQRAQDGLKAKKGWMKNIEANKPLKVKVRGILQGDKLIASSID